MANDHKYINWSARSLSADNQRGCPDCADRLAIKKGAQKCDEKGCPCYAEQGPDRVDKGLLRRSNTLDCDANGRLDQCKANNVHQNPDNVILHGFRVLPGIEILLKSSQSYKAPVYCQSSDCGVNDLGGIQLMLVLLREISLTVPHAIAASSTPNVPFSRRTYVLRDTATTESPKKMHDVTMIVNGKPSGVMILAAGSTFGFSIGVDLGKS